MNSLSTEIRQELTELKTFNANDFSSATADFQMNPALFTPIVVRALSRFSILLTKNGPKIIKNLRYVIAALRLIREIVREAKKLREEAK